ncbi:MAG: type II toxin-antitoxin system VapC family toxin [Silvibacterium sp.]|nr:type II toxin-antitoxin system VapC family toxin [Silvibacterium sp.]
MTSRYLLDTHVLLWLNSDLRRVPKRVIAALDEAAEVYFSASSAWELSIKQSLGKIRLASPVSSFAKQSNFLELPVTTRYAEAAATLPLHHRDPFDRLLVTQAIVEGLVLVTSDRQLSAYDVKILAI